MAGVEPGPVGGRSIGPSALVGRAPRGLGQPATGRFELGDASRLGAAERGQLVAAGLARRTEGADLLERLGQGALGVAEARLELGVPFGDGQGRLAPADREVGLGRPALGVEAVAVADDPCEVADQPRLAELQLGERGPGRLVSLAPLALERRPVAERRRQRGRRALRLGQLGHREVGVGPRSVEPADRRGASARRLVPTSVGGDDEGGSELVAGRRPGDLLLGLGGEPAGLRPELGEDVVDAGQVELGLGELLLGLPSPALVAAHAGDLLEQRPALLGSERERLVDHPLADEQEGVVGEVGRVEQVDEVAQADPLLVQQVVVLARPVQPATQLEDAVLDRQQPVAVVQDEGDVGHPDRGAPVGPGEDDVLALAAAQRPALLAEGPAERVGEVALARPVGADDRADPRPELDDRSFRKRLEAVEPQGEEPGRRRHAGAVSRRPGRAASAAAISADFCERPSPTPRTRPPTDTSTRKTFSWSGPIASTSR